MEEREGEGKEEVERDKEGGKREKRLGLGQAECSWEPGT